MPRQLSHAFRFAALLLPGRLLYFEMSETGDAENRRVVGSLSSTINAEVLRTLNTIPPAATPPRQQGRPVRVAYVVPINLKIQ